MKIKDSVTDIIKILEELDMKNKFVERIAKDEDALQRVRKQIVQAKEKQADSERIRTEFESQIDKLSIDEPSEDEEQFKVEMELQRMTKQYDGKTKVDKVEADSLVKNFLDELEKFQRNCENNLNRQIDQKIACQRNEYANRNQKSPPWPCSALPFKDKASFSVVFKIHPKQDQYTEKRCHSLQQYRILNQFIRQNYRKFLKIP